MPPNEDTFSLGILLACLLFFVRDPRSCKDADVGESLERTGQPDRHHGHHHHQHQYAMMQLPKLFDEPPAQKSPKFQVLGHLTMSMSRDNFLFLLCRWIGTISCSYYVESRQFPVLTMSMNRDNFLFLLCRWVATISCSYYVDESRQFPVLTMSMNRDNFLFLQNLKFNHSYIVVFHVN